MIMLCGYILCVSVLFIFVLVDIVIVIVLKLSLVRICSDPFMDTWEDYTSGQCY